MVYDNAAMFSILFHVLGNIYNSSFNNHPLLFRSGLVFLKELRKNEYN